MDSDWQEINQVQLPQPNHHYATIPNITTITFDTRQDLIWVGYSHGVITSYYHHQLELYTSLKAHPKDGGPVRHFLFNEKGIISVASGSVHFMIRRAVTQWHIEEPSMKDLCCMTFLGKDNQFILVAGCQKIMYKIDVEKGTLVEEIHTDSEYTIMKNCRFICAATSSGSVNFLDPGTLQVVKTWSAYTSVISSMDAKTDFLVTCGSSNRTYGPPQLEPLAKVFDLKQLEQLTPISFPGGAAFVQIHPKMSTATVLSTQIGQVQVVDIVTPGAVTILQVPLTGLMTSMVMAPSGNAWAIADQGNTLHLWGSPERLHFVENPQETEFADEPERVPHLGVDDDVPFSTIGMPFYRERLLSAWGNDMIFEVGKPTPRIEQEILKNMRPNPTGIGHISPNTRKDRPNQVENTRATGSNGTGAAEPKLLSEKARDSRGNDRGVNDAAEDLANMVLAEYTKADVPSYYAMPNIRIGRYGVEDFDFKHFNKTKYSGLENQITNSYMNPLLQLLRFVPLIRNPALHHTGGICIQDGCMLCELGFLIDMLEKAGGEICQATNFLKAYSSLPEAVQQNTVEEHAPQNALDVRLSTANRFLLRQMCLDFRRISTFDPTLDQILVTNYLQNIRCLNCHHESRRNELSYLTNLIYPELSSSRKSSHLPKFSDALRSGFQGSPNPKGWCQQCHRYQAPKDIRNMLTEVSPVLMIGPNFEKYPRSKPVWTNPGWVPREIGITIEGGNLMVFEGDQLNSFRHYRSMVVYELVGLVADVTSAERQKSHLVSFVNVSISERDPQEQNEWHLFNDFLVRKVNEEEALDFTPSWKTPVVLTYQIQRARHNIDDTWKESLNIQCLYYNGSMELLSSSPGHPLKPGHEIPELGLPVAIDAEFVSLQREEIELTAAGDRVVISEPRLGTGRVSVLRGWSGPEEGLPFIDDYISIAEPIVDHLTLYSGIEEGDLNYQTSRHTLMSLKIAYKKLWLLLNLGCIFVGHGLSKDFRTINLHVPKPQVIDTSDLYFHTKFNHRKLSLRFLAWFFLKEEIQTGNHDSIEDARTALRLWRHYEQLQNEGLAEQSIEDVYREGKKWNYKPPAEFEADRARRRRERMGGAGGGSSADLGGRMTPELGGGVLGGSGPVTPVGKGKGREEGAGYFESPLR